MNNLIFLMVDNNQKLNSAPIIRANNVKYANNQSEKKADIVEGKNSLIRLIELSKTLRKSKKISYIEGKVGVPRIFDIVSIIMIYLKSDLIKYYYRDMYWDFEGYVDNNDNNIKKKIKRKINIIFLGFLRVLKVNLIVQSEEFKDYILKQGYYNSEISVVLPAVDFQNYNKKNRSDESSSYIYVGEVDEVYSGIDLLISSFEYLKKNYSNNQSKLLIVCREEDLNKNKVLKQQIQTFDWISVEHRNKDNIHLSYEKSDYSIITRYKSEYTKLCIPLKLMEYISFRKPILISKHGASSKFVEKNNLGIVLDNESVSIANQINKFEKDYPKIKNIINNHNDYSLNNDWNSFLEKIFTVNKRR